MIDESMLPEGWHLVSLGSIGRWGSGGTPDRRRSDYYGGEIPWIKSGELDDGIIITTEETITEEGLANSSAKLVDAGTLLIAMYGATIGKLGIAGTRSSTNQAIAFCTPDPKQAMPEFLFQLLLYLRPTLIGLGKGGAQPNISQAVLKSLEIPLPPRDQQTQIVRALELVAARRQDAALRLKSAHSLIERFRQAVLAAACSGRLTADWREHSGGSVNALVEQLIKEHTTTNAPLAQPDYRLVEDIPKGWQIVTLQLLIEGIEAGKSFAAEPRPATEEEWGVIKVSAMSWGRFLEAENKAVLDRKRINPAYQIKPGDLLISRANTADLVGATVLVGDIRGHLLLSDKSLRLIPHRGVDRPWLNYILRSPLVRSQFSKQATGTSDSMRNLSQVKILSTTLPLPPSDEQSVISRRVDQLLSRADEVQHRIDVAVRRVERSSQAVLAKAFRGELSAIASEEQNVEFAV